MPSRCAMLVSRRWRAVELGHVDTPLLVGAQKGFHGGGRHGTKPRRSPISCRRARCEFGRILPDALRVPIYG